MAIIAPTNVADWVPLSTRQSESPMVGHDVICLHTMVGYLTSTDQMWRPDGYAGLESHFGVGGKWGPDVGLNLDGRVFQWQDLLYKADANLDGNPYVISVETADNAREPIQPWSEKQLDSLVRLLDWLCSKEAHTRCPQGWKCHNYGIPRSLIANTKPGQRGIGYHRQGITGNYPDGLVSGGVRWSKATGKTCPTDARITQIKNIIIPRLNASKEDDVPHFAVISGPNKPTRVFVDGSLVGFPNTTELAEFIKPFVAAGYVRKNIGFAEADDWQRYMDGVLRIDIVSNQVNAVRTIVDRTDLRSVDIQNRVGKVVDRLDSVQATLGEVHEHMVSAPMDEDSHPVDEDIHGDSPG